MKLLNLSLFIVFSFLSISSFAQEDCDEDYNEIANSIEKSEYKQFILKTFDVKFGPEENNIYLLEAQKNGYRVTFYPVDSNLQKRVDQFMSETSCKDCPLYFETKTKTPMKILYDSIQCRDVFQIKKLEEEFHLKMFRLVEEEFLDE